MSDFVHLHLHTTYSLLDGQCAIAPLVERARRLGMRALAVTDHGNLFALKSFHETCHSKKKQFADLPPIKPILGCEAYVTSTGDYTTRDKNEFRHHLCLHAKNKVGPDVPAAAQSEFLDLYQRQVKVAKGMLELGKKLDIRVIATNDVHFLDAADDDSHSCRVSGIFRTDRSAAAAA